MNLVDRLIGAVAPRTAERRALARVRTNQLSGIEQTMKARRRPDDWRINNPDARRLEARQGKPMSRYDRETIREMFDLNPFAVKLLSSWLNNTIGYGITATLKGSKRARLAWLLWERYCDYDGVLDLYGLQELVARTLKVDGEVFVVLRAEANASGVPLQLQVLDADMLDTTLALANSRIRDGIEYDAQGRPLAYHFRRSRELGTYGDATRVEARQVIHLYRRKRPGQRRGRSDFEPVLDVLEDVDGYIEAEGVRKKIAACFVGFRSISEEFDDPTVGPIDDEGLDPDEPPVESFYPGMIINGRPGETMTFGQPTADQGVGEYLRWGGLRMAAGGETTYEHATGDLSKVNYSSYRAGNMEFERCVGRAQWLSFLPQFLVRVGDEWILAASVAGLVTSTTAKPTIKWTPPPFGSIDRAKDVKADVMEVAAGFRSRREAVAARGLDLDDLSDEIAADDAMLKGKGLEFSANPTPAVPPAPGEGAASD